VITPSAVAADAMILANAEHTGVFENGGIVQNNTELWRFYTGRSVSSSPAVSNGVIYVKCGDGYLYAIGEVETTPTTMPTGVSNQKPTLSDLSIPRNQSIYWIVFLILLIGIIYEGWKAVKPGK